MELEVALDDHHLEGLSAKPITGLLELIWNALDADASRVEVVLADNGLGGLEEIRVVDNGHGMTRDEALKAFGLLGGSWKLGSQRSRSGERVLHGKHGQGRFRAAGIGAAIRWDTVADDGSGRRMQTSLKILEHKPKQLLIDDEPTPTEKPVGTTVVISGIGGPLEGIGESTADRLTAELALYLSQYHPTVVYDHKRLDPDALQTRRTRYDLGDQVSELAGGEDVRLDIIEWDREFPRALYLCNEDGIALGQVKAGIQAPSFTFTAYLSWPGFKTEADAAVAEMDSASGALVEIARGTLRRHFKERADENRRTQISEWKSENVYPFEEDPKGETEEAARELFDVVAVTARSAVNDSDVRGRRLSLRLLRQAIEHDPGSLGHVLNEVLDLPEEQLEELNALLRQSSLTNVIAASRSIASRLDFLRALDEMVHDPEIKKRVLERRQLHRILAAGETWVFGERFALTVDDESLRSVLQRHVDLLGRSELAPEELEQPVGGGGGGGEGIVDMMLARDVPLGSEQHEHLVVELKRPSVKVGSKELQQIKDYARAVWNDPRFDKAAVRWDFLVVSSEFSDSAEAEASQADREPGLVLVHKEGGKEAYVWAKTWGQIIDEARHRLQFVQENLKYDPSAQQAFAYLRSRHADYIPAELDAHSDTDDSD